ncbi:MAG TPA: hypothetical protein DEB09_04785 [Candidatus Magasanikbacteria bacterium]|nr:hypothetical protein [Candidatus Magasanikbacteria bacterium]
MVENENSLGLLRERHPEIRWEYYGEEVLDLDDSMYPVPEDILVDSLGNLWSISRVEGVKNRILYLRKPNTGRDEMFMFIGDGKRILAKKRDEIVTFLQKGTVSIAPASVTRKLNEAWSKVGLIKHKTRSGFALSDLKGGGFGSY